MKKRIKDEHPRYSAEFLGGKVERVAGLATGAAAEQGTRMKAGTGSAVETRTEFQNSQRGAALVIALATIVLVTVLVLSLFLLVTSERTESAAAANQGDSERLASGVVDLVKSTITQATTGYKSNASTGAPDTSSPVAWASQPGLIRTWDTSGNAYRSYRLYSSGNITVTTQGDLVTDTTDLANWKSGAPANAGSYNALWCDLNAPAANSAGGLTYPIVTPPKDTNSGSTATDTTNGVPTDNSTTASQEGVQGFSIKSPPGYTSGNASAVNNPAPMPVKWLYVLQDGSYVSPTGTGSNATVAGATQANPIIGRVAYWTDDDTSKVNINTASEGEFWQYPRTFGGQYPAQTTPSNNAMALAQYQPSRNEFQRYPGHPATTSLSAVLNNLTPNQIFSLVPRVQQGGSLSGTQSPFNNAINLSADVSRLYATTDELLYDPTRTANVPLTPSDVAKRSFFLTANSRAPETTLFETPRVSLWPATLPITTNPTTNKQDAFDKLLAFCATFNGTNTPFYFQRQDARSATFDWTNFTRNRELYAYLQNLTSAGRPIPGFGGSFATKFGGDRDQILTEMFDYIRSGPNLMGAGHVLAVGSNYTQNSYAYFGGFYDAALVVPIQIGTTKGFGNSWVIQQVGIGFFCEGMELAPPAGGPGSKIRYTVRAAPMVQLYRPSFMWDGSSPGPGDVQSSAYTGRGIWVRIANQSASTITAGGNGTTVSGSAITFPINDPVLVSRQREMVPVSPVFAFSTKLAPEGGVQNTSSNGSFTSANTAVFEFNTPTDPSTGVPFTVNPTSWDAAAPGNATRTPNVTAAFDTSNDSNLRMNFSGITLTLEILASDRTTVTQTVRVNIPGGTYAVPHWNFNTRSDFPPYIASALTSAAAQTKFSSIRADFKDRVRGGYSSGFNIANQGFAGMDGDVLLSAEINGTSRLRGDARLAAIRGLDAADFVMSAPSVRSPLKHAHAFAGCADSNILDLSKGLVVAGIPAASAGNMRYPGTSASAIDIPALTSTVNGTLKADGNLGDFDNAFGNRPDGSYINIPDTGAIGQDTTANIGPNAVPYFTNLASANATQMVAQFSSVYSPNRQMYSAFQMGSLPSRAVAGDPWETLLFCPNPAATRANHRGYTVGPKDYLLGDLFWMPIVDPYPISEPFSTAGKINLNYQIAPFGSYIERKTPLWALLKASKITAMDTTLSGGKAAYKMTTTNPTITTPNVSYVNDLDIVETLKGTDARFAGNEIFKSPTEIAEIFLVPKGRTLANVESWWTAQNFTGDNTREQPYAYLLPRLTTKSNTYTVHLRVQALKQVPGWRTTVADWGKWDETKDQVVSEYRGSASIERYVDPNDTSIPDFAQPANYSKNLAPYYRWRTLTEKQFLP